MSPVIAITGHVECVMETQTYPSGFSKRVLVINDGDDKYPQMIPVEFVKDKTALLDGLLKGQEITAHVNIRGNEHDGKYYCSIQGWKLEKGETPAVSQPRTTQGEPNYDDDGYEKIPF